MNATRKQPAGGPSGGIQLRPGVIRRWSWPARDGKSAPLRCKGEQWFFVRADGAAQAPTDVCLEFSGDQAARMPEIVRLLPTRDGLGGVLVGWVQSPKPATQVRVCLNGFETPSALTLVPVAERDPISHPLASTPRWSRIVPTPMPTHILLPASLEHLTPLIAHSPQRVLERPRSLADLAARSRDGICVFDPDWTKPLSASLAKLEKIAADCRLIVDIETFAALARSSGIDARVATLAAENEIISGRVMYADVATRGFALHDTFPYCTVDRRCNFRTRVLLASRAWKQYADLYALATLIASETPWENRNGDVLSAARPIAQGELIVTDLPWLVAADIRRRAGQSSACQSGACQSRDRKGAVGAGFEASSLDRFNPDAPARPLPYGRGPDRNGITSSPNLLAPRLMTHLLAMHLCAPLGDEVQYWNESDDTSSLVRDISELSRRFPPLRTARWTGEGALARLGVHLPALGGPARRHVLVRSGRIDRGAVHDGWPAEPLLIYCRELAREARAASEWARRFLAHTAFTWQFDVAGPTRYAALFQSGELPTAERIDIYRLTRSGHAASQARERVLPLWCNPGIFGDKSFEIQAELSRALRGVIEHTS
ncbi:MAG: hypothetical protein U1D55_01725 [Phycisphaerae bacterium]